MLNLDFLPSQRLDDGVRDIDRVELCSNVALMAFDRVPGNTEDTSDVIGGFALRAPLQEFALASAVKGDGLVVIAGCSQRLRGCERYAHKAFR